MGLDVRFVFPGHGEYIEDLPGIVSRYKKYHLIDEVFPVVPEGDIFLAISEIIVHLEILIEESRAELIDPGSPALYRAL